MTGRVAAALALCLVTIGLGACSSGSSPTPTASTSPPTVTSDSTSLGAPTPRQGDRYVALGSSIASGFGISEQDGSSCGRSNRDYSQLVAARYGLKLVDVSCGAAFIPNVVDTRQGDNPPQLDALTADTRLITISVGGNDIVFNGTALVCGNPATHCTAPADLDAKLAALPGQLRTMVDAIRAKSPSARIVFVTYPREMPATNCPAMSLDDDELSMLRSMGDKLEATFVDVFAKSNVVLVDPYAAPGDHTACAAPSERWTNGFTVPTGEGFSYHPTALGHRAMADLIEKALAG
ncbi:SGNH/GDSL hydrolase family protein [Pseudofrankia inefficax]|uniref:Lipolytic protein G-D-S-L family n=1 Tax=Pseudofrankia inefficax (strain DSM 45817 / CECT 9037 / DDB 130130 / EuI1c) TaxID=298654 RepID=E3J9G5_PSEI1|nr:SGNH/GDSL hydrolase family protein [Pseudofrankia inefficax]ADP83329.1 lipolytic protein G-D-S-L family [Pseudofrankia inefficax]